MAAQGDEPVRFVVQVHPLRMCLGRAPTNFRMKLNARPEDEENDDQKGNQS